MVPTDCRPPILAVAPSSASAAYIAAENFTCDGSAAAPTNAGGYRGRFAAGIRTGNRRRESWVTMLSSAASAKLIFLKNDGLCGMSEKRGWRDQSWRRR